MQPLEFRLDEPREMHVIERAYLNGKEISLKRSDGTYPTYDPKMDHVVALINPEAEKVEIMVFPNKTEELMNDEREDERQDALESLR